MTRNRDLGDVAPFVDGVSSNIQTQIDAKQGTISVTADRALISDGSGAVAVSTVTSTQLATVPNLAPIANPTFTGVVTTPQVNVTAQGSVRMEDAAGGEYAAFQAPTTLTASYIMTMPPNTGSTGQFLQTNGSGVLSFATVASPPTPGSIELTASGALTAGQAVVLNTSGQAQAVTTTVGTVALGTVSQRSTNGNGSQYGVIEFQPNREAWLNVYTNSQTAYLIGSSNAQNTDGTLGGLSDTTIQTGTHEMIDMALHPTHNVFGVTAIVNGSNLGIYSVYLNASLSAQVPDYLEISNLGNWTSQTCCYDASLGKFVVAAARGSNMYVFLVSMSASSSFTLDASLNLGDTFDADLKFTTMATDGNGQFCVLGANQVTTARSLTAVTFSISGTTITAGNLTTLSTDNVNSYGRSSIVYDSNEDRFVCAYWYSPSTTDYIYSKSFSISSNTIGTQATELLKTFPSYSNDAYVSLNFAPLIGVTAFYGSESSTNVIFSKRFTATAGTITFASEVSLATNKTANNNHMFSWSTSGSYYSGAVYHAGSFKVVSDGQYAASAKQTAVSNYTGFIGLTESSISSGASGKVTIIGGVNESQTGLTTASKTYVTTSGALSTTVSPVYAGVALSSTKLLVKG